MIADILIVLVVATLIWWAILGFGLLIMSLPGPMKDEPRNDQPAPPRVLKPGEWEYKPEPDPHIKAMMEAWRKLPDPVAAERLRILREEGRL